MKHNRIPQDEDFWYLFPEGPGPDYFFVVLPSLLKNNSTTLAQCASMNAHSLTCKECFEEQEPTFSVLKLIDIIAWP
jgi:hypothetical protein